MTDTAEPTREVGHFALLVLIGFMVMGSLLLSRRPPTLASMYNVIPVAALPPGSDLPYWRAFAQGYGALVPKTDWRPGTALMLGRAGEPGVPKLGYVVREWSFLSLPLIAYREGGYAIYTEDAGAFRVSPLGEGFEGELERQSGGRFWAGWWFPFWRYSWGLVAVAALAGWIWLELRWQARRRAIMGLI